MSLVAGIEGTLESKDADSVIVRVGGGLLLRVYVPAHEIGAMPASGAPLRLATHLIVREDDLQLYGFPSEHGRRLFEMLIGVSQVGPKAALAVLSVLPPEDLAAAIVSSDAVAISRAPGVGKRTAERIILDLKGKLEEEVGAPITTTAGVATTTGGTGDPALQWLMALGYSAIEARQALASEDGAADAALPTEERVRLALQRMGGG